MSLGAIQYGIKNNFSCKKTSTRKRRTTQLRLINLIIEGYNQNVIHDMDYFVSIAQYFMKKGYPINLIINKDTHDLRHYFMDVLFNVDVFHFESLIINKSGFNVFEWRTQFERFKETQLKGLNYYHRRSSIPLPDFTSTDELFRLILSNFGEYNEPTDKLKFSFNSCHEEATYIFRKQMLVKKDTFCYEIIYGFEEDKDDRTSSAWSISIESEVNENYIDFCLRIKDNYEAIISGSKDVLEPNHPVDDEKHFFLGGFFKLKY